MNQAMANSVTRMLAWRDRAMLPTVLLVAAGILRPILRFLSLNESQSLGFVWLVLLVWAIPLWLMLLATIFECSKRAFGSLAGVGYSFLAICLMPLFGLGVFVVPLMIRADIQLLDRTT